MVGLYLLLRRRLEKAYISVWENTWRPGGTLILSFQTLGVVYGRLSTSPLYVFGTIQTKDFKSNEIAYELQMQQVLIFVSFKPQPVPCVPPSQRYCVDRVGGKDYRIYRCVVTYGYCDQVRDTDDFEEQIIGSIGEFVSLDESDCESLTSLEGRRMVIVATPLLEGHALIPTDDTNLVSCSTNAANNETLAIPMGDLIRRNAPVRRKKVRFLIPESSPRLRVSVRDELQELINARESGTAYFPCQSHLTVREGSSF